VNDVQVLQIVTQMLGVATKLSAPILLVTLVIGIVVSLVQTLTQIQEMTLTFVPKLIGVGAVVLFGGNWMLRELVGWVAALWRSIPSML
jgi:flagellar biosynthesis protein FliQ